MFIMLPSPLLHRPESDEHGGDGNGHGDEGAASDIGDIYSERDGHSQHHAPSATVVPHGRGPSQATDFFSARGAPSILEVRRFRED